MSGEFVVDTTAMRSHASQLDDISASGQEAVSAGQTTTDGKAYGLICSFIGAAMVPAQLGGIAAAGLAASSVSSTATGLRTTADSYDAVDAAVRELFDKFGIGK